MADGIDYRDDLKVLEQSEGWSNVVRVHENSCSSFLGGG